MKDDETKSKSARLREAAERRRAGNAEISVAEAALLLDVTERTVLNLIKSKKVRAVKVGKRWFVDRASLVAFGKVMEPEWGLSENAEIEPHFPERQLKVPENSETAENKVHVSEKVRPVSAFSERHRGRQEREGVRGLCALNCYKMAVEIFARPAWRGLGSAATLANPESSAGPSSETSSFEECAGGPFVQMLWNRMVILQFEILECLGAGYHVYGSAKIAQYGRARAAAGSLLALAACSPGIAQGLVAERLLVEDKLLPALIALQRTAEKRRESAGSNQNLR